MLFILSDYACAKVDLPFNGILLDRPCHIAPNSSFQDIDFTDTSVRTFWSTPGRSSSKPINIQFMNCYPSTIGRIVKVSFDGVPEPELEGMLAVSGINKGKLGIALTESDGLTLIKLGSLPVKGVQVRGKSVEMDFSTYVQATPTAIQNRSVSPGVYQAQATFNVAYE